PPGLGQRPAAQPAAPAAQRNEHAPGLGQRPATPPTAPAAQRNEQTPASGRPAAPAPARPGIANPGLANPTPANPTPANPAPANAERTPPARTPATPPAAGANAPQRGTTESRPQPGTLPETARPGERPLGTRPPASAGSLPAQGVPGQRVPAQAIPGQTAPNQVAPGQGLPNRGAPNQAAPNQGLPNRGIPGQAAPNQTLPGQTPPTAVAPGANPNLPPGAQGERGRDGRPGQFPPGAQQGQVPGQVPGQPLPGQPGQPPRGGLSTGAAIGIGAAAGVAGGFLASQGLRRLEDVRQQRREEREGDVTVIREPGSTIYREGGRAFIRHDENERFRELGAPIRQQQNGSDTVTVFDRPDGSQIVTVTDSYGRLVSRQRRYPDGREVYLVDNGRLPRGDRPYDMRDEVVVLPPPQGYVPDRYILDADRADERQIYDTLMAPPVAPLPRRYSLDQVRASPDLRNRMPSVNIDTITFDTGTWEIAANQVNRLAAIADSLNRAIKAAPNEVFLVEGYTDTVGNDVDNLTLSDRRAQAVAAALTQSFNVPPENLFSQGYGEQYLKVQREGDVRENRRVTVRRVTPLLNQTAAH
ncbi:OmpA family protein, partial [Roseiarcaceae bacterium H3SJ34-1]|uniref:OmpA family protein n=1 Tax=Terripilifer ovatus TaxID=3032367 RepID=UPI003AB97ECE|nr:OmpA family protein [Roseiarcaceae bacterium H3SJ34-1]